MPCPALGSESQIHAADDSGESHKTCEMPLDAEVVMFSFFLHDFKFQIVCTIRLWLLLDHVGSFGGFKAKNNTCLNGYPTGALIFCRSLLYTCVRGAPYLPFSPPSLSKLMPSIAHLVIFDHRWSPTWSDGHVRSDFIDVSSLKNHCCGKKALETMRKV